MCSLHVHGFLMFVVFCFCWCVLWVKPTLDSGITIRYDLSAGVFYPEIHHLGVSGKGAYPPNLVLFRLGNLKMINHDKPSTDFVTLFFSDKPAVSCLEFEHWPSPTWWIWALWGSPILWIHITRALGHGSSPRKMVCSILPYMCKQQHVCTAYTLIQYMINQIYNYVYIYTTIQAAYIYIYMYTIYYIHNKI